MVRVTVNTAEAAVAVPEIKQRMLDAGCLGAADRRLPLQRSPALDATPGRGRGARQIPHQSRQRRNRPAARRTVRDDLQGRGRSRQAGADWRQRRLAQPGAGRRQDAGKHGRAGAACRPRKSSTNAWCCRRSSPPTSRSSRASGATRSSSRARCRVRATSSRSTATSRRRRSSRCIWVSPRPAWASKGIAWSASALAILLNEGIGDTIRVSLTPRPGGDRREEVYAACEILQALGLRSFSPSITACPGCGRTTSTTFQELAERIQSYVRTMMPVWKTTHPGVETMTVAVMGCVVNGPGESKAANIGISLPGTGESPNCPVFIDGVHTTTLKGTYDELAAAFQTLVDDYVERRYPARDRRLSNPRGSRFSVLGSVLRLASAA